MTIATKFNINDEVWFIHPKTQIAESGKIGFISIDVQGTEILEPDNKKGLSETGDYKEKSQEIVYQIYNGSRCEILKKENHIFSTKQELINSL